MERRLAANGFVLDDFVLRNITFSPEYAASVEQKQIAEQLAQQAAFVVQQRKQEAEQARQVAQGRADAVVIDAKGAAEARLIQAEAESKALQLISDVLKQNQALLTYQYVNKLGAGHPGDAGTQQLAADPAAANAQRARAARQYNRTDTLELRPAVTGG